MADFGAGVEHREAKVVGQGVNRRAKPLQAEPAGVILKHQKRDLRAEMVVELIGRALFHQGDGVGEGQLVQAPVGFGGDFDDRIGARQKPPGGWVGRQYFIQEGGGEPLKREPQHNNL